MKTRGKKVTMFILTLVLAMGMIGSSVFAAQSDPEQQRMGEPGTEGRNIGKVTWNKIYNLNGSKWPDKNNFEYKVEKVKWWDNSNKSTDENGTEGTDLSKMPLPHNGTVKTGSPYNCESGKSTIVKVNLTESNAKLDNNTKEYNKSLESNFEFTRPGYYLYKVTEICDEIKGVTYDYHTYYIAFYVANDTEDGTRNGKTVGGDVNEDGSNLYVHTITAFRSAVGKGTNPQEGLTEEQVIEYIQTSVDPAWTNGSIKNYVKVDIATDKDLADAKADECEYRVYTSADDVIKNQAVVKKTELQKGKAYWKSATYEEANALVEAGEVEKTNRSQDGTPNKLTVKFWNRSETGDLTLEKKVTGTLGDLQKEFEFTVKLEGLNKNEKYNVSKSENAPQFTANDDLKQDGTTWVVQAKENGTAEFVVKLKGGDSINIEGLNVGANYTFEEKASDHQASYEFLAQGTTKGTSYTIKEGDTLKSLTEKGYVKVDPSTGKVSALKASDIGEVNDIISNVAKIKGFANGNSGKDQSLSTVKESVDQEDGGMKIVFTNHRDFETETGIPFFVFPIAAAGILALIALAVIRRRKNVATVNDFEF